MFLIRDCEILGRCLSLKSETSRYLISADTDFKRKRKDYYFILCCYLFQRETKKSFFKRITNNSIRFTFVHSSRYCFSNGPQKCSACIKEDIFEDPTSILKQGCVSISDSAIRVISVKPKKMILRISWLQAFPDNAVRREVEHLPAVCINENCTWKGSIKEYEVSRFWRARHALRSRPK